MTNKGINAKTACHSSLDALHTINCRALKSVVNCMNIGHGKFFITYYVTTVTVLLQH